jgi:HSF-type DNA-binding
MFHQSQSIERIAMGTITKESNALAELNFPRTGKRGVPQQFPRRLFEMLEGETKAVDANPNHLTLIAWSESGKAFRIFNVAEFSKSILPRYFRTTKFSSFQRNLNLVSIVKAMLRLLVAEFRIKPSTIAFWFSVLMRSRIGHVSKLPCCDLAQYYTHSRERSTFFLNFTVRFHKGPSRCGHRHVHSPLLQERRP